MEKKAHRGRIWRIMGNEQFTRGMWDERSPHQNLTTRGAPTAAMALTRRCKRLRLCVKTPVRQCVYSPDGLFHDARPPILPGLCDTIFNTTCAVRRLPSPRSSSVRAVVCRRSISLAACWMKFCTEGRAGCLQSVTPPERNLGF